MSTPASDATPVAGAPLRTATEILSSPLQLPCGATISSRCCKCSMQETLAVGPLFDPPMSTFKNLYAAWGQGSYGLILTGQVQVDTRFLSVPGDVCVRKESLLEPTLSLWKEWAAIAQAGSSLCVVQLAHPGRMSRKGAGLRPDDMETMCPSSVPVDLGGSEKDKQAIAAMFGTPREMTVEDIDDIVERFVIGARVAQAAGFAGAQIHGAHGFLVSQFLSPHTNRRNDDYGGTPEKRLFFLKRLIREMREACPAPFILGVKLNSGDYMKEGGLTQLEALEQVRYLTTCGMVDMIEISGGTAEAGSQGTSRLHGSYGKKSLSAAPKMRESTRIRESFFTDFAEMIKAMGSTVPIQLSGGFRSRTGMADAIESGICDLVGLGRAAVIQPSLPRDILLNPNVPDSEAFALSHQLKGQWITRVMPKGIVGTGIPIRFFYYQMRRVGNGFATDPRVGLPWIVFLGLLESFKQRLLNMFGLLSFLRR